VDKFGNPVTGAKVTWDHTARDGALSAPTSSTDSSGLASVKYVLSSLPGGDTVSASVSGGVRDAAFVLQAIAVPPGAVSIVSGEGQSGTPESAVADPLVVRVTDSTGKAVRGATVTWSATNGTIVGAGTTGDDGIASAKVTLGSKSGECAVSATTANGR